MDTTEESTCNGGPWGGPPNRAKGESKVSPRVRMAMLAGVAVCLLMAGPAYAFFPFGGFTEVNKTLRYMTWPLKYLDTNGDGDVGPGEGVHWVLEREQTTVDQVRDEEGNLVAVYTTTGWSEAEQAILRQGFQVWEDVPTSYIAFQVVADISEPLVVRPVDNLDYVLGDFATGIDFINYVMVEDPGEETLPTGVLGVTLLTLVLDDMFLELPGTNASIQVSGGQIVECDIVYSGAAFRERTIEIDTGGGSTTIQTLPATYDLLATHVHEVGHSIGLGHTPLNNFSDFLDDSANTGLIADLEQRVFWQRNRSGLLVQVGVTPTMYPIYFATDLGEGKFMAGGADLAPDDIAGVSFLYPRGSQARFFRLAHEARSQTRVDFPSVPLPGAHIIAWSDADQNVGTRRVPMFSTMSGLYEHQAEFSGRFSLFNLLKQHETGDGVTFDATYVITSNPINGLTEPKGYTSGDFDSTRVLFGQRDFSFPTAYPSEVFNETGNLLGIEQREQGTPLTYNMLTGQIVSATSGKTLNTMLPGSKPMFGVRNDVCWLNVVVAGMAPSAGIPQFLRGLRDGYLLNSPVGTAFIDAYYRTAPPLARYLATHPVALGYARSIFSGMEWVFRHAEMLFMATAGLLGLSVVLQLRRWRAARTAASLFVVAGLLLAGGSADALLVKMSPEEMVKASDYIFVGTVEASESFYLKENVIVTDVTIRTDDNMKGHLNKGGQIVLRQPGGRVGAIMRYVTDLPQFREGEEVVVFMQTQKRRGPAAVVCGERGKLPVHTDALNGKKYVVFGETALGVSQTEKAGAPEKASAPQRMELEEFKTYLRGIDQKLKADEEAAANDE